MHKELTLRIPNVKTPATRYAFDDMVVECRNFEDVRMYFTAFTTTPSRTSTNSTTSSTILLVDTPESPTTTIEDNVEFPDSPNTTIESPATSPTTTYNLELERTFGYYDYSTASTSTSSCTKFIFPPSTSPINKHCINDCDDSMSTTTSST